MIGGRNGDKFGKPDADYKDKNVCVRGEIDQFRGVAQIEARDPSQVTGEKRYRFEKEFSCVEEYSFWQPLSF